MVSKSGVPLERGPIDVSVYSPERLIFEAGARLDDPRLQQRRPPPEYVAQEGAALDTRRAPVLLPADENQYAAMVAKAKADPAIKARIARVKAVYENKQVEELLNVVHTTDGVPDMSVSVAKQIVRSRMALTLTPRDIVQTDDHGPQWVHELLSNPLKWVGQTTADPLEPDYGGGRDKGIIQEDTQGLYIYSQAHGGRVFRLKHDADSLIGLLSSMSEDDVGAEWAWMAARAELGVAGSNRLQRFLKEKIRLTKKDFEQELEDAQKEMKEDVPYTHHEIATALHATLQATYGEGIVADLGEIWACVFATWMRIEAASLEVQVGRDYQGKLCQRKADYASIVKHTYSIGQRSQFFDQAPIGLAAGGKFYRLEAGKGLVVEELLADHRQRFHLEFTPAEMPTPLWDAFLASSLQHELDWDSFWMTGEGHPSGQIETMHELIGCALTGSMHLLKTVLLLHGKTDSGKSMVGRFLKSLLPPSAVCSVHPADWAHEYNRAAMAVARLNLAGEISHKFIEDIGVFKEITGGDATNCRNPYGVPFTSEITAAQWFSANTWPSTTHADEAFWRRWVVLEFPNSIPKDKQIPNLEDRLLEEEAPGIVWRCLQAAGRVAERGFRLTPSAASEAAKLDWRYLANTVMAFLGDETAVDRSDPNAEAIASTVVYATYVMWCAEQGRKPLGRNKFLDEMRSHVQTGGRGNVGNTTFKGLQLLNPAASVSPLMSTPV